MLFPILFVKIKTEKGELCSWYNQSFANKVFLIYNESAMKPEKKKSIRGDVYAI